MVLQGGRGRPERNSYPLLASQAQHIGRHNPSTAQDSGLQGDCEQILTYVLRDLSVLRDFQVHYLRRYGTCVLETHANVELLASPNHCCRSCPFSLMFRN